MAILAFQKPDNVIMLKEDAFHGKFEFRPLEPGYGITIGNALRRILLSSLEGFAITSIKIEGVEHEFATIPGVIEDVTGIILNLKKVRFKRLVEEFESEKVSLHISGTEVFKAGDIGKVLTGFEVLNPDLEICHMEKKAEIRLELSINKGRGYVPADENRTLLPPDDVQTIAIDSIFTPIRNVKYEIENYRIEQKTDYEKLIIEVSTDGSIRPKEALKKHQNTYSAFVLFSDDENHGRITRCRRHRGVRRRGAHMRQLLKRKLSDLISRCELLTVSRQPM